MLQQELKSAQEILKAQSSSELKITRTNILINSPAIQQQWWKENPAIACKRNLTEGVRKPIHSIIIITIGLLLLIIVSAKMERAKLRCSCSFIKIVATYRTMYENRQNWNGL